MKMKKKKWWRPGSEINESSIPVEDDETQVAAPRSFWWLGQRWLQTIHVIATIAVVAKQQLLLKPKNDIEQSRDYRLQFLTRRRPLSAGQHIFIHILYIIFLYYIIILYYYIILLYYIIILYFIIILLLYYIYIFIIYFLVISSGPSTLFTCSTKRTEHRNWIRQPNVEHNRPSSNASETRAIAT